MSRRLQNRQRLQVAATAAIAADRWMGRARRQQALAALSSETAIQPLLPDLAEIPRIARRLPNAIGGLLDTFSEHPDLAPWLQSEQDFFRLCRMAGATLYGNDLARFVDGDDVTALVDDLGPDAWRFGIENALEPAAAEPPRPTLDRPILDRNDLTDILLAAGLRAVHAHLQETLPDRLDDIAAALDLDRNEIDRNGDADRDSEAVHRVLAHVRTT
jgi:hypothetical protein